MIYTINNCIRAFGYTSFDRLIEDMGSVDGLKEYVRANGYADIAVAEDTELLLVDVNGKTWHTGCYGAVIEPPKPYLCFTSTGDSTVAMTQNGTPNTSAGKVIQYKLNNGQWQTWDLSAVSLADGDKMYLKSDDEISMAESTSIYKKFVMTGSIAASDNIMSLLNFSDTLVDYAFCYLFKGCTSLTQAPELPATTLTRYCYSNMFEACSSLTQAPVLPATTLAQRCYFTMFSNCISLEQAPELPATTLAYGCYHSMFAYCISLVQAPALPATTLKDCDRCYSSMFYYCKSLTQAPELPATTLSEYCYNNMFSNCTSLTQVTELPALNLLYACYESMFENCKELTTAPVLPAITLNGDCYHFMFSGCSKLNYVKAMFTTIRKDALDRWLSNVSPTGTFIKSKDATWTNEQAGIPSGWTVQVEGGVTPEPEPEKDYLCFTSTGDSTVCLLQFGTPDTSANKVIQYKLNDGQWQTWDLSEVSLHDGDKMYLKSDDEIQITESYNVFKRFDMTGSIAASGNIMSLLNFSTTLADYEFLYLFNACSSLTTAPELPATTLAEYCYANMFVNCVSLTQAPELPANTLAQRCYNSMFKGCTSLVQAPALPATTLFDYCYYIMFEGCTSLINAPALPATTLAKGCYSSMFNGCTSLVTAPELPATTLTTWCYNNIFSNCSSLNYVKAMFIDIQSGGDFANFWLDGVSSTGTFVKNSAATWTKDEAGIPSGWTVQTASPDK